MLDGESTLLKQPEPKYRQVADRLRSDIGTGMLPVGERLPPMAELATFNDVSLTTAFRAVQLIGDEGLVEGKGGRGGTVVVRRHPVRTLAQMAVAGLLRCPRARTDDDNFALDMINGLREELSGSGRRLLYHGLDEPSYTERVAELLDSRQVCGCLIDQNAPLAAIRRLAASAVPCVLFNRHEDVQGLSTVTPDYEQIAGRQSARLFRQWGYEAAGILQEDARNE